MPRIQMALSSFYRTLQTQSGLSAMNFCSSMNVELHIYR